MCSILYHILFVFSSFSFITKKRRVFFSSFYATVFLVALYIRLVPVIIAIAPSSSFIIPIPFPVFGTFVIVCSSSVTIENSMSSSIITCFNCAVVSISPAFIFVPSVNITSLFAFHFKFSIALSLPPNAAPVGFVPYNKSSVVFSNFIFVPVELYVTL